jgi:hypothetical protein
MVVVVAVLLGVTSAVFREVKLQNAHEEACAAAGGVVVLYRGSRRCVAYRDFIEINPEEK